MNINEGIIKIGNETFLPGYTFEDLKKSEFFDNQDGIRIINLKNSQIIDDNKFIVSLFFRKGFLYLISLICIDKDISFKDEPERKKLHDEILTKYGLQSPGVFDWGKIESNYDPKGNVSSINIIYNAGL